MSDEDMTPAERHVDKMLKSSRLQDFDPIDHDMRNPHEATDCESDTCQFCVGGIEVCATCGGAEASLTTYCPGEKMKGQTELDVLNGRIDFDGRLWVEL